MSPRAADQVVALPLVGTRVWLEGPPGGPWATTVESTRAGGAVLGTPRLAGPPLRLTAGDAVVVAYRLREVPCEVPAVLGAALLRPELGHPVRYTAPPVRMRRRDAVRVPVRLMAIARPGGPARPEEAVGAITDNLSAGGALLRMPGGLAPGTAVALVLSCGGTAGDVAAQAVVIRSDRVAAGPRAFRVAVAFAGLPTADEDRIVRMLFERQRELRRRERESG